MTINKCPTCGHCKIDDDVKEHVVTLYRQGLVQKEIAQQLGISQPYVSRILKQQVTETKNNVRLNLEDEI